MIFSRYKKPKTAGWYWIIGGLGAPIPIQVYQHETIGLMLDGWGGDRNVERNNDVEWGDKFADSTPVPQVTP